MEVRKGRSVTGQVGDVVLKLSSRTANICERDPGSTRNIYRYCLIKKHFEGSTSRSHAGFRLSPE